METADPAPDAWDSDMGGPDSGGGAVGQLKDQMANLNVNATSFVPGQNINAFSFVPSWLPKAEPAQPIPVETAEPSAMDVAHAACPSGDDAPMPESTEKTGSSAEAAASADLCASNAVVEDALEDEGDLEVRAEQVKTKRKPAEVVVKDKKEPVNIVFIGHVDAGKSTIGGHLMYLTGMVDKRTLEKYEKEAKELNRESWYLSWALDTNIEEREKGKTVEVGRAYFETEHKHFTVLDAPGHRSFVPNMIGGASQADIAVLVISARKGEFETGFERGGQTREHAMLVKTAGVKHLVILINKMDDPTVEWSEERFKECRDKLLPYLKKVGFNPKTDIYFMPCSGLNGAFLKERPDDARAAWYSGLTFLEYIDQLPSLTRNADGPVRMPVIDRYKDMGTIVLGKIESGTMTIGQKLVLMPNKLQVEVMSLWSDDVETDVVYSGENVKVKLKNVEEEDVTSGFVLCSADNVCKTGKIFDAQVAVLEHKSIICSGYSAVLHVHACAEEVTMTHLIRLIDKKTGEPSSTAPRFIKQDQVAIVRFELNNGIICMETYKEFPQMGRFTLRDEGRTVGIGKILKIIQ